MKRLSRKRTAAFALSTSVLIATAACGTSPQAASSPAAPAVLSVTLSAAEVRTILLQAASQAQADGLAAVIVVSDRQGKEIGLATMDGAPAETVVPGTLGQGLEGLALPASLAAHTKAGTGALLSSGGQAFSTRTASFIVQDHFPPAVLETPGGPLFGVQFSSLPCTDVAPPALPLGLAGDPGGMPLYKSGVLVGGIGVEGDGVFAGDLDPADDDVSLEERAAVAGTRGFTPPPLIRADNILADGIRLAYANAVLPEPQAPPALVDSLTATDGEPSPFVAATLGSVAGLVAPRYPTRAGARLSAAEVTTILTQAAQQTIVTRAAIRQPLGSSARVSIAVVDLDGSVLGFFQNEDAPSFGIDVSVQKARTANFFSQPLAASELAGAGLGAYAHEVPLDGSFAFTSRAVGFLAEPHFPPGIGDTEAGPFSRPFSEWSAFNTGLQLDLVKEAVLGGARGRCSAAIPRLPNGITLFPGGVPLYKDGVLAGAIGISGDGVDQDDLIASAGSVGFEAPPAVRSDRLIVRGVRLPWVKFPRHPEL